MVYEWKIPKYSLPAQSAGEELERIERKHGRITPGNVLEESRPTGAVLHSLFEWNDSAAAENFVWSRPGRSLATLRWSA